MSKKQDQIYKQAKMKRDNVIDVSWIPSKYAKVGKNLQFKLKDGSWDQGGTWRVEEVYSGHRTVEDIDRQRDAQKRWEDVLDHGVRE